MKFKSLLFAALAALFSFASCEQFENIGLPELSVNVADTLEFDVKGGSQELTFLATRSWKVETDATWISFDPEYGDASAEEQTVVITVLDNSQEGSLDRSAKVCFVLGDGLDEFELTVNQIGVGGSAESLIVYSNDFCVSKAEKVDNSWPYLDGNEAVWDNKEGTGSESVQYAFGGKMSVRTSGKLSNDESGYSHYAGSGSNKVFFGAATSTFKITGIGLDDSKADYKLSFGGQKYGQNASGNVFSFDEFKVYLSADAQKWVPVTMAFPADADLDGDWNLASGTFSLPAGTSSLSIAFVCSESSVYSIDDVLLEVVAEAGQTIDFSAGVELDGTTPSEPVTPSGEPETLVKATVKEFIEAEESTTVWYELTGTITSIVTGNAYGNLYINDGTAEVYIYGLTNGWVGSNDQSFASIGLKVGDTVTLGTLRGSYNGVAQGGGSALPAFYISHVEGEVQEPVAPTEVTVAEFLLAPEDGVVYKLTGKIANVKNTYYGNFDLVDETGSVYIYGIVDESGAKVYESLGLKEGDTVTVTGNRKSYNGTPQMTNAICVSHVAGEVEPEPEVPAGPVVSTVADFLAAADTTGIWYELTGTISNLKNTTYGNFDLVDETGSVYVYGLTATQVSSNDKSFASIGLNEGDVVTLRGQYGTYKGSPQVVGPAYYVSHVAGEEGGEDTGDDAPVVGNKADFETLTANTSYVTSTADAGWVLTNCAVQVYGTENESGKFDFVPEDTKAACMNGKTSAVGTIESPLISGGCGTLSFDYAYAFAESNGVSFKVEVIQNDTVVKSFDVVNAAAEKLAKYSHSEEINVSGHFKLKFTNNSPSNSAKNKDRYSIWNISWTSVTK